VWDASFCLRLGVSGHTGSIFFWSDVRDKEEDERDKDMSRTVPMRRTYGNSKQWISALFHLVLSSFQRETTIRIPVIPIMTSEKNKRTSIMTQRTANKYVHNSRQSTLSRRAARAHTSRRPLTLLLARARLAMKPDVLLYPYPLVMAEQCKSGPKGRWE
jgi:hypothetical protein